MKPLPLFRKRLLAETRSRFPTALGILGHVGFVSKNIRLAERILFGAGLFTWGLLI